MFLAILLTWSLAAAHQADENSTNRPQGPEAKGPLTPPLSPSDGERVNASDVVTSSQTQQRTLSPALPAGIAVRVGQLLLPPGLQDRLRLNGEQQERAGKLVADFVQQNRDQLAPLAEQLRQVVRDLRDARQKEDRSAFQSSQEQLQSALRKLAMWRSRLQSGLFDIMTDEQRENYSKLEPELLRPAIFFAATQANGSPAAIDRPRRIATSSMLKPLTELTNGNYHGFEGGLYPGGRNTRPPVHEAAGHELAARIQALDESGKPSPRGKIVLLTIGMSNTMQASTGFQQAATRDFEINPQVIIVNGAQGGQTAARTQDPDDHASGSTYWNTVDERLRSAGVSREQVEVAWIKQADANPSEDFPQYASKLEAELARIVQVLHQRFPNLKLVYLSSRTFGGFAKTPLNPEPYAYESGFAVKWLIEKQISGDPVMNFDSGKGQVTSPWLSWGPYLWANGTEPRVDGFYYKPTDFSEQDGTHESAEGQAKVGQELLKFFKTDTTTKTWFLKGDAPG